MVRLLRGGRRGAARGCVSMSVRVCVWHEKVSAVKRSPSHAARRADRLIHLRCPRRYQHAVANPGLITFTGPYLDVGGAGYVVTISHTIHASR